MSSPEEVVPAVDQAGESLAFAPTRPNSFGATRGLRPSTKVLPEHARRHNRSLVLQTLYGSGAQSRADVSRSTGLTRVTVSELVAGLMAEGLIVERGQREVGRPGKPATLIDIDRGRFQMVGVDLSEYSVFRGAVLDLGGEILSRAKIPLANSTGEGAAAKVEALVATLVGRATAPLLGIGVGSPGVVDLSGVVLSAPNLGFTDEPLQTRLAERFGLPVIVMNDANAAVLAEHSFGDAKSDMMLITVGHGVGAGLLMGGSPLFGSRFAAGEIGHVVVGTDGGDECNCGKHGCLETWLAGPRLDAKLAAAEDDAARTAILEAAGTRLGIALAPVVGALNLSEIVLSGRLDVLAGPLADATIATLHSRTSPEIQGEVVLRMTTLGEDIVLRGAGVAVLSRQLGFS